jgi:hypothetical protein
MYRVFMPFRRGDRVVAGADDKRVGTVLGLAREKPIETLNEGIVGVLRNYVVRWPMPDGSEADGEVAEAALRLATEEEISAADS